MNDEPIHRTSKEKNPGPGARQLAEMFHERYERLAPQFGYTTRTDTRRFDHGSHNGKLMIAVCDEILTWLDEGAPAEIERLTKERWNGEPRMPCANCDRLLAALEKIGYPEKGLRPQDQKPFLQGYTPEHVKIARAALNGEPGSPAETGAFRCRAQRTADPPQDCDWPHCGCDEHATKVLVALQEEGFDDAVARYRWLRENLKHVVIGALRREGDSLADLSAHRMDAVIDRERTASKASAESP